MGRAAWDDPRLHIKGIKDVVEKQRAVLLGQHRASYSHPSVREGAEWQKKAEISKLRFKSRVDLREGGDLQQREYPQVKQSHTHETHDDIVFRSRSAKETARKVATEGIQADSKARRQADNKSYLTQYQEWDREFVPANLMPDHKAAGVPYPLESTKTKTDRRVRNNNVSTVNEYLKEHEGWKNHLNTHNNENHAPYPPQLLRKGKAKWEGNITIEGLTERDCDGPQDPKYSTQQREYWDKSRAYKEVGNGPRGTMIGTNNPSNDTAPEMAHAMGVVGHHAFEKPLEPEPYVNYKGHMGAGSVNTRDMKATMQGKWMREDKIDPYETENRRVFQGKKGVMKMQTEQNITKSRVNFKDPRCAVGGVQWCTESGESLKMAASFSSKHPNPQPRFPRDRTHATVGENLSNMEFMGPRCAGVRLDFPYRPNTVHGNIYNDNRIVRDGGVNMTEYGKPEVWSKLKAPTDYVSADPSVRQNTNQTKMEHLGAPNTNYRTAHRDYMTDPGRQYLAENVGFLRKDMITKSNVNLTHACANSPDLSHGDLRKAASGRVPAGAYYASQPKDRTNTYERTRNASDMILWRNIATSQRSQYNIAERERAQRVGGATNKFY